MIFPSVDLWPGSTPPAESSSSDARGSENGDGQPSAGHSGSNRIRYLRSSILACITYGRCSKLSRISKTSFRRSSVILAPRITAASDFSGSSKDVFSFSPLLTALPARLSRVVERSYRKEAPLCSSSRRKSARSATLIGLRLVSRSRLWRVGYGYDFRSCWRNEG